MSKKTFSYEKQQFVVDLVETMDGHVAAKINDQPFSADIEKIDENSYTILHKNRLQTAHVAVSKEHVYVSVDGESYVFGRVDLSRSAFRGGSESGGGDENIISAPMPGKILKMMVKKGQKVAKNTTLFIVEAMKMENEVKAPRDGVIKKVHFKENDLVTVGAVIVELD